MAGFLIKKTAGMALVLFGASFLTYSMILLAPGDAAREIAVARYGGESQLDRATVEYIREQEGLDQPFLVQYGRWLSHVGQLDFGYSLVEEAGVLHLICARFLKNPGTGRRLHPDCPDRIPAPGHPGRAGPGLLAGFHIGLPVRAGAFHSQFLAGSAFNHPFFRLSTLAAQFRDRWMAASDHAGHHPGDLHYRLHSQAASPFGNPEPGIGACPCLKGQGDRLPKGSGKAHI